ncbi:hypothetical protein evm_001925 [Chilo suppressalis]|nr:hypothetical protein evm_001925 [Chilo suppressalis]
MYQKRTRKIKKGSQLTRLREARRIQRMQMASPPPSSDDSSHPPSPQTVDRVDKNRVILDLAWKTVALMHKSRLIQQKIVALRKETSEFVASVMKNPENIRRYVEYVRFYGVPQRLQLQILTENTPVIKVEPAN